MQPPKEILHKYWGHTGFRGSQERIIDSILDGQDVLALMPTGGGKSICYQIPSLALNGLCIVVSLLIALIQNQVAELKNKGLNAIALTGGLCNEEVSELLDNCEFGNYKFLYLSPERIQQTIVQDRIRNMKVNLLAIDEAHCISQWGNDFRPAYLNCAILRELHPETPMIALTATATPAVSEEICSNLKLRNPLIVKDSFSRTNIKLQVLHTQDKHYHLKRLFRSKPVSAIVYVKTRRKTVEISNYLNQNSIQAAFYHGGMSKNEKATKLNDWLAERTPVMVATNAFGMGVDKPNVRLVIHYQIPDSIENYFQEAGRAGRDGLHARAVLLTNQSDIEFAKKQFLATLPHTDFIKTVYRRLSSYLQIAYGEGHGESYGLNFNVFCHRYGFNSLLTYNTLKILDQYSVISLTESYHKRTTVFFTSSKEAIFSYLENQKELAHITLVLLRTYGGIFEFQTKIDTLLLAKKSQVGEEQVHRTLEKLHNDGIISYETSTNDLELTFLVPREDDKTIHTFAKQLKKLQQLKKDKLSKILAYVSDDRTCRTNTILRYFGESPKQNCGHCDYCEKLDTKTSPQLKALVLNQLKSKAMNSRLLSSVLSSEPKAILRILRELLEDEIIEINQKNEYVIRE